MRRIQLIFQNPDDSLNPRHTIAQILEQPLRLYFGLTGAALHARSAEILDRVRLGAHYLDRLPSQLSGGEKQRVAIARAFAAEPDLVLCDEVTSALDVSVQDQILTLLERIRDGMGLSYLFISHDLGVIRFHDALQGPVVVHDLPGCSCQVALSRADSGLQAEEATLGRQHPVRQQAQRLRHRGQPLRVVGRMA